MQTQSRMYNGFPCEAVLLNVDVPNAASVLNWPPSVTYHPQYLLIGGGYGTPDHRYDTVDAEIQQCPFDFNIFYLGPGWKPSTYIPIIVERKTCCFFMLLLRATDGTPTW